MQHMDYNLYITFQITIYHSIQQTVKHIALKFLDFPQNRVSSIKEEQQLRQNEAFMFTLVNVNLEGILEHL